MDPIKEAFSKIKNDISNMQKEIYNIKNNQITANSLLEKIEEINKKIDFFYKTETPTIPTETPTIPTETPTIPTDFEKKTALEEFKVQNYAFSKRNDGVQTNRQTDKQTNRQTYKFIKLNQKTNDSEYNINYFDKASNILENLDNIKKGIRRTFKNLTNQEMLVFSTLYSLDEKKVEDISYKTLSDMLKLSESSIRDYVNKLINKGILIEKHRINNKRVSLNISNKLKEIANLSTIIKLRNI